MKKKLTEGNDRVKIAAVSEKKISQGRQVRGKSGQVCIWLNSLLRGVMKVVKRNLHLKKISVEKRKEIESEERIKKIQGREKSFPSYGRVRIVSSKRPFVKLYDILCWH